jgi:hypothetical protein
MNRKGILCGDRLRIHWGNSVSAALQLLIDDGILNAEQGLIGFPHPAGGNGHRARQFAEAKTRLAKQVADWFEGVRT